MGFNTEIITLIEAIRNNKTHGASQLARQAVKVLRTAAEHSQAKNTGEFRREQQEIGQKLISTRPAMAPIFNIVSRLLEATADTGMELDSIRQRAIAEANKLANASLKAVAQIAAYVTGLIADGDIILTHSYSSTVTAALEAAFTTHSSIEVITTRSGPGRTGERTARELAIHGIPLTFIDDAAVGLYLPRASKVMVGADRICADGGVVNGIGTYPLALVTKKARLPFYVLCETLKFDPRLSSDEVVLEEKEPAEVVEAGRLPPGVTIKNPYFDITPPELVTVVITENGRLSGKDIFRYLQNLLPS